MEPQLISQAVQFGGIGIAAISIVALVWITKYLLDANAKREESLSGIIANHIDHTTTAMTDLTVAIKELSTIIREKIK